MEIHLSNFVKNIKDYRLKNNDERTLFDWVVQKQYDFGLGRPFFHSVDQVQKATLTTKYEQKQIFGKFVNMGFLTLGEERHMNHPYRTFLVSFSVLSKPEVLRNIVEPGTETFDNLISNFTHWVKEEKKNQKPPTKKRLKELEAEALAVDALLEAMVKCWNERVEMYNNGILTGEKPKRLRVYACGLVPNVGEKKLIAKLRNNFNDEVIKRAFIVQADKTLKEEISPKHILSYFLTYKDGDFPVIREFSDYYTTCYGSGG